MFKCKLGLTHISLGNMTHRSTFSVWKFPWKYDLLWRRKLQDTGISNRFQAVSTVSGAFHPISRADESPRPLMLSHLPLFAISFLGKCLNTNISVLLIKKIIVLITLPQQNAICVEFGPILHEACAPHKRNSSDFPGNFQGNTVGEREIW